MELLFWLFAVSLIPCVLQYVILRLTPLRLKGLRWLLLLAVLIFLIRAWQIGSSASPLFPGLAGLAALLDLILAACVLLGWGAAWGLYALRKRRKENPRETTNPPV